MKFEYDRNKSLVNKQKHGVSLKEAELLWLSPHIEIKVKTVVDEPRFMVIGQLGEKFYSCIYTTRGSDTIRLISARRSRKNEEAIYHEYIEI